MGTTQSKEGKPKQQPTLMDKKRKQSASEVFALAAKRHAGSKALSKERPCQRREDQAQKTDTTSRVEQSLLKSNEYFNDW